MEGGGENWRGESAEQESELESLLYECVREYHSFETPDVPIRKLNAALRDLDFPLDSGPEGRTFQTVFKKDGFAWFSKLCDRISGHEKGMHLGDGFHSSWKTFEPQGCWLELASDPVCGIAVTRELMELLHPHGRLMSYVHHLSDPKKVHEHWGQWRQGQEPNASAGNYIAFPFVVLPCVTQRDWLRHWRRALSGTPMPATSAARHAPQTPFFYHPVWCPASASQPFVVDMRTNLIVSALITPFPYFMLRFGTYLWKKSESYAPRDCVPQSDLFETAAKHARRAGRAAAYAASVVSNVAGQRDLDATADAYHHAKGSGSREYRSLSCAENEPGFAVLFDMLQCHYLPTPGQPFLQAHTSARYQKLVERESAGTSASRGGYVKAAYGYAATLASAAKTKTRGDGGGGGGDHCPDSSGLWGGVLASYGGQGSGASPEALPAYCNYMFAACLTESWVTGILDLYALLDPKAGLGGGLVHDLSMLSKGETHEEAPEGKITLIKVNAEAASEDLQCRVLITTQPFHAILQAAQFHEFLSGYPSYFMHGGGGGGGGGGGSSAHVSMQRALLSKAVCVDVKGAALRYVHLLFQMANGAAGEHCSFPSTELAPTLETLRLWATLLSPFRISAVHLPEQLVAAHTSGGGGAASGGSVLVPLSVPNVASVPPPSPCLLNLTTTGSVGGGGGGSGAGGGAHANPARSVPSIFLELFASVVEGLAGVGGKGAAPAVSSELLAALPDAVARAAAVAAPPARGGFGNRGVGYAPAELEKLQWVRGCRKELSFLVGQASSEPAVQAAVEEAFRSAVARLASEATEAAAAAAAAAAASPMRGRGSMAPASPQVGGGVGGGGGSSAAAAAASAAAAAAAAAAAQYHHTPGLRFLLEAEQLLCSTPFLCDWEHSLLAKIGRKTTGGVASAAARLVRALPVLQKGLGVAQAVAGALTWWTDDEHAGCQPLSYAQSRLWRESADVLRHAMITMNQLGGGLSQAPAVPGKGIEAYWKSYICNYHEAYVTLFKDAVELFQSENVRDSRVCTEAVLAALHRVVGCVAEPVALAALRDFHKPPPQQQQQQQQAQGGFAGRRQAQMQAGGAAATALFHLPQETWHSCTNGLRGFHDNIARLCLDLKYRKSQIESKVDRCAGVVPPCLLDELLGMLVSLDSSNVMESLSRMERADQLGDGAGGAMPYPSAAAPTGGCGGGRAAATAPDLSHRLGKEDYSGYELTKAGRQKVLSTGAPFEFTDVRQRSVVGKDGKVGVAYVELAGPDSRWRNLESKLPTHLRARYFPYRRPPDTSEIRKALAVTRKMDAWLFRTIDSLHMQGYLEQGLQTAWVNAHADSLLSQDVSDAIETAHTAASAHNGPVVVRIPVQLDSGNTLEVDLKRGWARELGPDGRSVTQYLLQRKLLDPPTLRILSRTYVLMAFAALVLYLFFYDFWLLQISVALPAAVCLVGLQKKPIVRATPI